MPYPTKIDETAPIVVRMERDMLATPAIIWALHAAPNAYPEWQHSIIESSLNGPFEPGTVFVWTSYGFTVTPEIYDIEEPTRTLWGGSADGITGIHEWQFLPLVNGTRVITAESWSGPAVAAAHDEMEAALIASLDAWLTNLAAAAERDTH